jgi:hypothetical protein
MNSGLKAGTAHYFPMTGSGNVKVIASKDLSGRTIPLVKDEGTGGQACFNVCYSKSMIPYKDPEPKKDAEKKDPPPATVIQLPARRQHRCRYLFLHLHQRNKWCWIGQVNQY